MSFLIALIALNLLLALIPGGVARSRGRSFIGFYLFGIAFFLPALVVALVMPSAGMPSRSLSEGSGYKQLGQLRPPRSRTSISALPEAEWAEAGTPDYEELLAQADGEVSLLDLLRAANPNELPKPTRKLLRVPLEVLPSHLGHQERVERVADAASGSVRGLLVLTTERLVLLDRVSGVVELEIPCDDCTACVGAEKSVLVWCAEGAPRFMHISPSSLEPQADSDPSAAGSSETGPVPRLRVCPECEGEFTPVLLRDTCPDCGGVLIPVN